MHQGMLTDKEMLALRVDLDDKLPPPLSKTFDQIRVALGGRNEGIHQGSKDSLLGILPRGQNQAGSVGAPLNHVDTIMMRIVEEGYKLPSTEVTLSASQVLAGLLYTSDAAEDQPCVDLGGPRILRTKKPHYTDNGA